MTVERRRVMTVALMLVGAVLAGAWKHPPGTLSVHAASQSREAPIKAPPFTWSRNDNGTVTAVFDADIDTDAMMKAGLAAVIEKAFDDKIRLASIRRLDAGDIVAEGATGMYFMLRSGTRTMKVTAFKVSSG